MRVSKRRGRVDLRVWTCHGFPPARHFHGETLKILPHFRQNRPSTTVRHRKPRSSETRVNCVLLQILVQSHKFLQRNRQDYKSNLRVRVAGGLNKRDFNWCIKKLEENGCITLTIGDKGGVLVRFREQESAVV